MGVAVGSAVLAVIALAVGGLAAARRFPARVGPVRPLVVGVLLAATAVVFAVEARRPVLPGLDLPALDAVVAARSGVLTAVARALSLGGGTVPTATAGVLAALVLWWAGRPRWALVWVLAVVTGSLVIRFVKLAVQRPRPPVATRLDVETTASLPSGHALMAALGLGLVAVVVLVLPRTAGGRRAGRVAGGTVVALALAIGASRVYLGVHWASDVLAGWMLGGALALTAWTVATAVDPRPGVGLRPARPTVARLDRSGPRATEVVTERDVTRGY